MTGIVKYFVAKFLEGKKLNIKQKLWILSIRLKNI